MIDNGRVAYPAMQQGDINDDDEMEVAAFPVFNAVNQNHDIPHYPIFPAFVAPPTSHPIPPQPIVTAPTVPAGVRLGRYMIGERAAPTAEQEDDGIAYDSDSAVDEDDEG